CSAEIDPLRRAGRAAEAEPAPDAIGRDPDERKRPWIPDDRAEGGSEDARTYAECQQPRQQEVEADEGQKRHRRAACEPGRKGVRGRLEAAEPMHPVRPGSPPAGAWPDGPSDTAAHGYL